MADIVKKVVIQVDSTEATKSVDDLKNALQETGDQLKDTKTQSKDISQSFNEMKEGLSVTNIASKGLTGTLKGLATGFMSVVKQMWAMVANPVGAILAAIVLAAGALYAIFSKFKPITDKIEQAFAAIVAIGSTLKNMFIGLFTGAKSLTESFSGLGSSMSNAAKEAAALTKAQQELDEQMNINSVNNKKYETEIANLIVQSKNRTLTEKERIALNNQAIEIERKQFEENSAIAKATYNNALKQIEINSTLTDEEIANVKKRGLVYLYELQNNKDISDEDIQRFKDAQIEIYNIQQKSTDLREKAQNRADSLIDAANAKKEAAEAKALAASEKRKADAIAKKEKMQEANIKKETDMLNIFTLQAGDLDEKRLTEPSYFNLRTRLVEQQYEQELKILETKKKYGKVNAEEEQIALLTANNNKAKATKDLYDKLSAIDKEAYDKKKESDAKKVEDDKKKYDDEYNTRVEYLSMAESNIMNTYAARLQYSKDIEQQILDNTSMTELERTKALEDNAAKRKAIEQEERDAKVGLALEAVNSIREIDKAATTVATTLLQQKLKNGEINQEQYDKKLAAIQKKAAIRAKAYAVADTVINTAAAIMKILATGGVLGIPLAIAAGLTGAAQIATIIATPIDGTASTAPTPTITAAEAPAATAQTTTPAVSTAPNTSFNFGGGQEQSGSNVSKTYVLNSDVKNAEALQRATIANGSI